MLKKQLHMNMNLEKARCISELFVLKPDTRCICNLLKHITNLSYKKNRTKAKNTRAPGEATNYPVSPKIRQCLILIFASKVVLGLIFRGCIMFP